MKTLIIGSSSGIGSALALLLASKGHTVGLMARRAVLLETLKAKHPDQFHISVADVTNQAHLINELNNLVDQMGGLDLLVFSAGVGELNEALAIDLEMPTIDVNVKAFNEVMVWAYHYFAQQKAGQIVVITSIAGLRGNAIAPAYNASKAYQLNYLEGLRQKARKQNLKLSISDIRPGFVDTAMAKGDKKFWVASPEKAAAQILHAINAKRSVIYITKRWKIVAWVLKILPRFLYERM